MTDQFLSKHINDLRNELSKEKNELLQKESAFHLAETKEKGLLSAIQAKKAEIAKRDADIKALESKLANTNTRTADQGITAIQREIDRDREVIATLEKQINGLKEKIAATQKEIEKDEAALHLKSSGKSATEESKKQAQLQIDRKKTERDAFKAELTHMETELASIHRNNEIVEDVVEALKHGAVEKKNELDRAEREQKDALRNMGLKTHL